MGMFGTIRATLSCRVCGSTGKREIQTNEGPCLLLNRELGDTIEPFSMATIGWKGDGIATSAKRKLPKTNAGSSPIQSLSTA